MSIDELTRDRLLEIEDLRESLLSERRGVAAWCPHEPYEKQSAFLDCPSLEALYGGQAGGGKSDALLMGALQYVDVPGYNAVIFRRTVPDLLKPEAILTRALEWLAPHVNARRIQYFSQFWLSSFCTI